MKSIRLVLSAGFAALAATAPAQTVDNLAALHGLAPFSVLGNSAAGKAALAANLRVTFAIQNGTAGQPLLLPFAQQQQQALRDAFITGGNADQLADGLGSRLGGAYTALTSFSRAADGKTLAFTNITPGIGNLLGYSFALSGADSNSGKYFFANGTQHSGKAAAVPATPAAAAILTAAGGSEDVFGKAYGHAAGAPAADPAGDSRPFQTEPSYLRYNGNDYFGAPSGNNAYLVGPAQDLTASPAFPSGHTTYGYTESVLLGIMAPARYQQMIVRGAEYGNDRIVLDAHYAMDVIAGRALALYDVAHLLANDPAYVGQKEGKATPIADYMAAVTAARRDLQKALAAKCGESFAACAAEDTSRLKDAAANKAFYESTQTYGLPVVYPATAARTEDVAKLAPQAGYLLKAAYPALSLSRADKILTATEGPGGGFLDNGSAFGLYSRLDLYKAAGQAAAQHD